MNPDKIKIEDSWKSILSEEFNKDYFDKIVQFIKDEKKNEKVIYPPGSLIFNAFELTPFDEVKVVILGQGSLLQPWRGNGSLFFCAFRQKGTSFACEHIQRNQA